MTRLSRPIGKADLEFYEHHMIEVAAKALFGKGEEAWASLSDRSRVRIRGKALRTIHALLSDRRVVERLPLLTRNLLERR